MNADYIVVQPQLLYAEALASAYADYLCAGEEKYVEMYSLGVKNYPAYIEELINLEKGINLSDGWVPEVTRWLINGEHKIIGIVRVRSRLTPVLEEGIGHIGYDVPPSQRKKGYGHHCMKVAMQIAKDLELAKVLVTCDAGNSASRRIIEASGAQFENEIIPQGQSNPVRRYWLNI